MRFLGKVEVAAFLTIQPAYAEGVRAWLNEISRRNWPSAEALSTDFLHADISAPPVIVFHLAAGAVCIETLVDFRNGIVLLTAIRERVPTHANPASFGMSRRAH